MKKRLTLDMAWALCMKQWASIMQSLKKDPEADISDLKLAWAIRHDYKDVMCNCFFCEYDIQHPLAINPATNCNCPAKKIDKNFGCCNQSYNYMHDPHAFYKKLKSLRREYKGLKC